MGALTRDANAEESVAEKIPAEINGANPDTMLITLKKSNKNEKSLTNNFKKEHYPIYHYYSNKGD